MGAGVCIVERVEHRRGRSWWLVVGSAEAGRSWVVDRQALAELGFEGEGTGRPGCRDLDEAEHATARRRALVLLGHRARSEAELRRLLSLWPFQEDSIDDTMAWLRRLGYLDDPTLARDMVEARTVRAPVGREALMAEMQARGIDPAAARRALEESYPRDRERQAALDLARRRARVLAGLEPREQARRLWAFLARRGFDEETVREAVSAVTGDPDA